jgi:NADH-ubiquinone oxidoreductase chain 5
MEGPTPVSALLHAATMVTAGVYLLMRLSPLLEYSSLILNFILWIGGISALFGAICGLLENDLKKIIAFSTTSQLGYMIVACGISQYNLALFHLLNHAFFKALLFLAAGAIIHSLNDEQDMRK